MIVEIFTAIISLDFNWLVQLVMNNLFGVFGILAASYFIFNKKKTILGLGVIFFVLFTADDFTNRIGWVYLAPAFLATYYLLELAFLTGFENTEGLKKYFVVGEEIIFISSLLIFNIFIR